MGRNLGPLNIKDSYEGLVQISGSQLTDGSGSLISSLDITASNASQAGTSGYAATALSASYATTASFALNVSTPNLQEVTDQGATTTNAISIVAGGAGTATYDGNSITTTNAGTFTIEGGTTTDADLLLKANDTGDVSILLDGTSDSIIFTGDVSGSGTITAGGFTGNLTGNADTATSASYATSASQADTASIAEDLVPTANISIASISASDATFVSASIGHLTTVTGSAVIIGDAYVIVNSSPTSRYAGIKVYESGAAVPTTASLEFDSVTNDWFYEYTGSDPTNFGAVMFGPEYSTKGSPIYPTANTLVKGNGGHHVVDSSITDDGTDVVVNANISASGFVSASTYYGDGSNLTGLVTSAFPYTGSADITGSLNLTGSFTLGTGPYNQSINIQNNGSTNTINTDGGNIASVVVGRNNVSGKQDYVYGESNTLPGISNSSRNMAFGYSNDITSTNFSTGNILLGYNNTIGSGNGNGRVVIGFQNTVNTGNYSGVFAGHSNTITSGVDSVIIGGTSNVVNNGATYSAILGGNGNSIATGGQNNVILGGANNSITNTNHGAIIAGFSNTVSSNKSWILGSDSSTNNGGEYNGIVGGINATSAHNYSVTIGGNGLSTSKAEEAVVKHLSVYGDTFIDSATLGSGSLIDNLGQEGLTTTTEVKHIVHCTQAEYDALTPDANTLYVIDGAETLGDTNVDGYLTGTVNTLVDVAGTTTLDCSVGNYFTLAMPAGGSTTLTPTNIQAGQTINIKITQNATASTLAYAATIDFPGGTAFTISTGSGEVDVLTLVSFDGTSLQATGLANFS